MRPPRPAGRPAPGQQIPNVGAREPPGAAASSAAPAAAGRQAHCGPPARSV